MVEEDLWKADEHLKKFSSKLDIRKLSSAHTVQEIQVLRSLRRRLLW